jgi:hypothetical protein
MDQIKSYKTLDKNLTFLARLEDFCKILKPDRTFAIPPNLDLTKAREVYHEGEVIQEEEGEDSDSSNQENLFFTSRQDKWGEDKKEDNDFNNAPWAVFNSDDEDKTQEGHKKYLKKREEECPPIIIALPADEGLRHYKDEDVIFVILRNFRIKYFLI